MAKKWVSATIRCQDMASFSVGGFTIRKGFEDVVEDKSIADRCRGQKGLLVVDHYENDDYVNDLSNDEELKLNPVKQEEAVKVTRKLRPKNR